MMKMKMRMEGSVVWKEGNETTWKWYTRWNCLLKFMNIVCKHICKTCFSSDVKLFLKILGHAGL